MCSARGACDIRAPPKNDKKHREVVETSKKKYTAWNNNSYRPQLKSNLKENLLETVNNSKFLIQTNLDLVQKSPWYKLQNEDKPEKHILVVVIQK